MNLGYAYELTLFVLGHGVLLGRRICGGSRIASGALDGAAEVQEKGGPPPGVARLPKAQSVVKVSK